MCLYVAGHMNIISSVRESAVHDLSLLRRDDVSTFRRTVVASSAGSRRLFLHSFYTEAEGTTVLRNVGYSLNDKASYAGRL